MRLIGKGGGIKKSVANIFTTDEPTFIDWNNGTLLHST